MSGPAPRHDGVVVGRRRVSGHGGAVVRVAARAGKIIPPIVTTGLRLDKGEAPRQDGNWLHGHLSWRVSLDQPLGWRARYRSGAVKSGQVR